MRRDLRIFCLYVLLSSIIVSPAFGVQVSDQDEAVTLVVERLLPQGTDDVLLSVWGPIQAGMDVRGTKELAMTAPAEGYVVYIDDFPTANLFHAVRYAFVDAGSGELIVAQAMSPPLNFEDYREIETLIGQRLKAVQNRRAPIPDHSPGPTRTDRWAVLMNGGLSQGSNHPRYWNDLSNIYIALNYTYGFADDHIIVLCSDGLDPAPDQSNGENSPPDLDGDMDDDINFSCVRANVNLVFGQLASILTAEDKLFVFTTDHGSSIGGWSTLFNLWNMQELTDADFASLLAALPQCEIICTFEPCFSGGFLDDVVVPPGPRVASSACRHDEYSWAMANLEYDEYVFHWTAAVKGEDAYGNPVNADYNMDGVITMDEAFQYAESHDQKPESPQYGDYPLGVGAGLSLWPTGTVAFLVVSDKEIDDIGGNNNGAADPGETISMVVTLNNVGSGMATNITGTLTTTDPYLTVTQDLSYYPDLGQFEQGQGSPAYEIDISSGCPQGETVTCNLHIEADSAYTNDVVITFVAGDPLYDPVGPDAYGYYAYDILDVPLGPTYNWIEVAPAVGGPGTELTELTLQDDRSTLVTLPFTFRYYGQDYNELTVCTNGWIAMGNAVADSDWSNSAIPDLDGPPAMIAPFWEDMNLETGGQIATYYDAVEAYFVVEYFRVPQQSPATALETFEVIFYDPAVHTTPTGDGKILVQYYDIVDPSECTVGIENSIETIGLQYLYDGTYDVHAAPIRPEMAILFTAIESMPDVVVQLYPFNPPIQIQAAGGTFSYSISITNNMGTTQTFNIWCDVTLPSGAPYGPVLGPVNLTVPAGFANDRDRDQAVPGNAPTGIYSYNAYTGVYPSVIWSSDAFDFEKLATGDGTPVSGWNNRGEPFEAIQNGETVLPDKFSLHGAYPNPFNPVATLSFELPEANFVKLAVYDIAGRMVTEMVNGWRDAGIHEVTFDASSLASGIYVYRLEAGQFSASGKMVLMK